MPLRENLRVVLHQVRSVDNLGAVARLLANFDFQDLTLSDPHAATFSGAERMAVKAGHVLEGMRVVPTLKEALADTVYAVGGTSREDVEARVALTPEEAVRRLALEAERGRVALVFGGEQRGLSDEELAACDDVLVIPTSTVQPSMNLAQAAAALLYLCAREVRPAQTGPAPEPAAQARVLQVLEETMRGTLLEAGFLNPQQSELILRELLRALTRGRPTQREAELWVAAFKQLSRAVKR